MRHAVLTLAFAATIGALSEVHAASAIEMRDWCREIALKIDDPSATAGTFDAGYCLGSFITLRNAAMLNGLPHVCAPNGATTGDFMRVYIRMMDSMQQMPASATDNWFVAALAILKYEYPCPN